MKINGETSDIAFYYDLVEFYEQNKKKLNKKLNIKNQSHLLDFCCDLIAKNDERTVVNINYNYICKLVYIFINVLGSPMPEHIHNRLILSENNEWVKKYIQYIKNMKPHYCGFINTNKNNFKSNYLSTRGNLAFFGKK
jgi:hypothetical protein